MKKIQLNAAKLQLHKERISSLTNEEMSNVNGGGILWSLIGKCGTSSNQPDPGPPQEPLSCKNNETNICGGGSIQ